MQFGQVAGQTYVTIVAVAAAWAIPPENATLSKYKDRSELFGPFPILLIIWRAAAVQEPRVLL